MSEPSQPPKPSRDLVAVAAVIVAAGLVAAMVWTKDQEEKFVYNPTDQAVLRNLQQLMAGADEYFLDNSVSSVASSSLVGTNSSQYVRNFVIVAQETYTPVILQGRRISAMGVAGARTVTFGP
jgi:type IV pilus assembly protein PilA